MSLCVQLVTRDYNSKKNVLMRLMRCSGANCTAVAVRSQPNNLTCPSAPALASSPCSLHCTQ